MFKEKVFTLAVVLAIIVLIVFGNSFLAYSEEQNITLDWTCGSVGGGWYTQGAGIGELFKEKAPEITIKAIPGGGTLNPPRIGSGEVLIGWGVFAMDVMAFKGEGIYEKAYPDLRALGGEF